MELQFCPALQKLNRLYREWDGLYHAMALRAGLSDSAFVIFYALAELGEGCRQKEIAEYYSLSRQTISSSIRRLEKERYLYLKPGKRRDMHIYLTDAGRQIVREKIAPVIAMENSVFDALGTEAGEALTALTEKCVGLYREKLHAQLQEGCAAQCPPAERDGHGASL